MSGLYLQNLCTLSSIAQKYRGEVLEAQRIQIRNGRNSHKKAHLLPSAHTTLHKSIPSTYYVMVGAEDTSMKLRQTKQNKRHPKTWPILLRR